MKGMFGIVLFVLGTVLIFAGLGLFALSPERQENIVYGLTLVIFGLLVGSIGIFEKAHEYRAHPH